MSAVTIPVSLPATLIVLSADVIERIDGMTLKSSDLIISDYASTKPADQLLKEMGAMVKEIEATRKSLTAPLDAIKAQAIEAERMGTLPLTGAIKALQGRVAAAITAHNAELERMRKVAEAERQRLQKLEDEAAEARRLELQKQADLNAPMGEEPEQISVLAELPRSIPAVYIPPPVKSAAIRNVVEYSLEYINGDNVPILSAMGHELRPIDEMALKKFLKSLPEGRQEIPGAVRLIKTQATAAKGSNS